MQVTIHQAGLGAPTALAQRIALAALAIFLMLNALTPFITPDPPWLARAERVRTAPSPNSEATVSSLHVRRQRRGM
jgi:hypothetical protein